MKASTQQHDDGIDIDSGFAHVVRPAAGLEPVQSTAPNSVFGLAGWAAQALPPPPNPSKRGPISPPRQGQALDTIRSCGPMTAQQFASAMELSAKQASKLLYNMKSVGKIVSLAAADGARYAVSGDVQATVLRSKPARPKTALINLPDALETPPDPELSCAIFNTGAMLIEVPHSPPLRLTPRHVAELISYLRTLRGGLQ